MTDQLNALQAINDQNLLTATGGGTDTTLGWALTPPLPGMHYQAKGKIKSPNQDLQNLRGSTHFG